MFRQPMVQKNPDDLHVGVRVKVMVLEEEKNLVRLNIGVSEHRNVV